MTRVLPVVVPDADDETRLVRIPIVGRRLTAGFPSPADDFTEEALELPRWLAPNPPATFLWRVTGWSVVGAGIHDGDLAVVDRSLSPVSGDIVVAVTHSDADAAQRTALSGASPRICPRSAEANYGHQRPSGSPSREPAHDDRQPSRSSVQPTSVELLRLAERGGRCRAAAGDCDARHA